MHQHHPILARFCVCRIVGVSINVLCFGFYVAIWMGALNCELN